MKNESLGFYVDTKTGDRYEVLKRTSVSDYKPLSSNKVKSYEENYDYITKCGIDLDPKDDSLLEFELIQIDGTIKKE